MIKRYIIPALMLCATLCFKTSKAQTPEYKYYYVTFPHMFEAGAGDQGFWVDKKHVGLADLCKIMGAKGYRLVNPPASYSSGSAADLIFELQERADRFVVETEMKNSGLT